MQYEILDLSHQSLLESKFKVLDLPLSEYSFANLYLFRKIHDYHILKDEDEVFIRGLTRDKIPFIMPTSPPYQIQDQSWSKALQYAQVVFPILESWIDFFSERIIESWYEDADSDYLFKISKMAKYSGRHLDGKRNQVQQFLKNFEARVENLSSQFLDAHLILDHWQATQAHQGKTDYESCQEAIDNMSQLKLSGIIVYANDLPAGLIIGEQINSNCATIHFSKADHSIKGIYQYLFQEYAKRIEKKCSWINLEQDLGIPSLRMAKISYQPDLLIKKWRIRLKR